MSDKQARVLQTCLILCKICGAEMKRKFSEITSDKALLNRYFSYVVCFGLGLAALNAFITDMSNTGWFFAACSALIAVTLMIKRLRNNTKLVEYLMLVCCLLGAISQPWLHPEDISYGSWFTLMPIIFFLIGGVTKGLIFSGILLAAYVFVGFILPSLEARAGIPPEIVIDAASAFVLSAMFSYVFERTNTHFQRKLSEQLLTDYLTGIYNRRAMQDLLVHEIAEVWRYKHKLSLLMFDIDHFKEINDRFGHDTGDVVINSVVNVIKQNVRSTDFFARWGGEEFLLLTPHTPLESAHLLAERLREHIEKENVPQCGPVTVSVGVTEFHEGEKLEEFIKRADLSLYSAKNAGRNRVAQCA